MFHFIGLSISVVAFLVFKVLLDAWVICILWGWFVSPIFSVAELTIPAAVGIRCTMILFQHTPDSPVVSQEEGLSREEKFMKSARLMLSTVAKPLFVLLLGWVAHLWM